MIFFLLHPNASWDKLSFVYFGFGFEFVLSVAFFFF